MNEIAQKPGTLTVKVVGDRMDKTIVTSLVRQVRHLKYGKYIKRSTKLFAHDPENSAKVGDTVVIEPSRPLSKRKHWLLVKIIKQEA